MGDKFEGRMLLHLFASSFTEDSYLRVQLTSQVSLHVSALLVPNISPFTGFPIPRPSAVFCFAWPWCPPTCNGTRQCLQGHFSNQPPPGRISNFANNPMGSWSSRTHLLPSQWPLKPCWTKISWISPPFIAKPCGNLKKRDTKMAKKVNEIISLFFLLILNNHHLHHRIPKLHPDFSSPSTVMIIWTWNRNATVFKIMAMLWLSSVLTQNDVVSTRKRILTPGPTQSSGGRPLGRLKSPSMKILRRHNRQHDDHPSKPCFTDRFHPFAFAQVSSSLLQ